MRFGNLFKKELGELLTKQAIISMVFTLVLFVVLGQVIGNSMDDSFDYSSVNVCVKDDSEFTKNVVDRINSSESTRLNIVELQSDNYYDELKRLDLKYIVVIPEGYGDSITKDNSPAELIFASTVKPGFSTSMSSMSSTDAIDVIEEYTADEAMEATYNLSAEQVELIRSPAKLVEYSAANGKSVKVSPSEVTALLMVQSMIAPFAIFFLMLMASQMIMTAISTEKIDKTLETLLSTPVSRMSVLMAKMLAALVSALINAVVMIIGFAIYMISLVGGVASSIVESGALDQATAAAAETIGSADVMSVTQGLAELGFTISGLDILLFGLQLFLSIAIGLSLSLILGAMATDVKSVQTLTMPIMMAVMLPFFVTMFVDFGSMPTAFKAVMFVIPFTHSYNALTNLMTNDLAMFWGGFAYQIAFFAVCMFLAVRMFTSDKLFTMAFATENKAAKQKKLFSK